METFHAIQRHGETVFTKSVRRRFAASIVALSAVVFFSNTALAQTIGQGGNLAGSITVSISQSPVGQVITPPSGLPLTKFSFTLEPRSSSGGAVTPQVAEWTGGVPGGAQGVVRWTGTSTFIAGGPQRVVEFSTGGIAIDPTKQYVIQLLSTDANGISMSNAATSTYTGGGMRFPSQAFADDMVFSATFAAVTSVTGLSPSTGQAGTSVAITGTLLTGATSVTFGGVPAAGFTVVSDTEIRAVAPAGSGTVDVIITTPSATSANTAADNFTYVVPVPTLSEWALILFGTVLAGSAALYIQRRRQRV